MCCQLEYIPDHLKQAKRPVLEEFSIGEILYHRCTEEKKLDPFDKISLVDVSVNRSGTIENKLSQPEDVLFNINPTPEKPFQKYDLSIACLEIKELNEENKYIKEVTEPPSTPEEPNPDNQLKAEIKLKHKPEECNYSHSACEFYFNNVEVTYENWSVTLGRDNGKTRKLRTRCKQAIAIMILQEVVRINW